MYMSKKKGGQLHKFETKETGQKMIEVSQKLHLFYINNQKFKQSPRKSLTISKQFAGVNKRRKLNNPL